MNRTRILGIVILVAGATSLFFANYIANQVREGKIQIVKGEKTINAGNKLFSLNPATEQVGKMATSSAQKKIDSGKNQVAYYENMAKNLQTSGIIGLVLGGGIFLYSFAGSKKRRR